jgi:membrane protease subunit HflK
VDDLGAVDFVKARAEHERRAAEAEVLTRDEYLLAIGYSVRYRVVDARAWRFGHEDPDSLVGALAEGALRSAASRLAWRDVLNDTAGALQREVHTRLAQRVRALGLGCEIVAVDVRSAHVPESVQLAFRDVASASEEGTAGLNRARQSVAIKQAAAHGDALSIMRTAEADALRETTRASGEAGAWLALGKAWAARPAETAAALRFEQLRRSIAGRTLLIVLGRITIDTYDRSGGGLAPMPPADIFLGPQDSDGARSPRDDR